MTEDTLSWRQRGALLIIILGGFALRLYRLGAQSLWYDETVSAHLASKSMPGLIAHTAGDIHPPGYYLLLHIWTRLSGDSEFALTFFSLVFGVLLIPLTFAVARYLLGQMVALWAALMVAISPFHLWYSQEARMYTLGAALGMVVLWCALHFTLPPAPSLKGRGSLVGYLFGYVLAATVGLYVLYYFAFLLVVLNLFLIGHLLWNRRYRALRNWLLAQVAVLVLYVPWLPIAWRQATNPPVPPWRSLIPPQTVAVEAWTALSLGQSVQPGQVWPILLVTGILLLLGLYQISNAQSRTRAPHASAYVSVLETQILLVAYAFGPLLLIYLASLIVPLYHVRYLFTYAPAFYILLGAGLAWLTRRVWPLAVVAVLTLLAGSAFSIYELHTNPRYAADDFRAAVDFIAQRWRPGDAVLINAGYAYPGFLYYYDGPITDRVRLTAFEPTDHLVFPQPQLPLLLSTGTIDGDPNLGWGNPDSDFYAASQVETAAALNRLTETFPRIWMLRIYDTVTDPDGVVRDWLATNTTPFDDGSFTGESFIRVQGFMSTNQPPPPQEAEVGLEGGITLMGWEVTPTGGQRAGQPMDVVLWWRMDAPLASDAQWPDTPYAVSLKLWEAEGQGTESKLGAQQDEWPMGGLFLTSDWPPGHNVRHPMRLWLPPDLPAGQYKLEVEMYDPTTLQPLPRRDGQGHTVPVGSVTVTPGQ